MLTIRVDGNSIGQGLYLGDKLADIGTIWLAGDDATIGVRVCLETDVKEIDSAGSSCSRG